MNKVALTPSNNELFKQGHGKMSSQEKKEIFHSIIVAKALFVANRSRPDILPTVSVLSGQVRAPNRDD